ncbi:hypothetical protein ACQPZA_36420 [Pseudonocardia xinjiangensis]|uniref:hypothetical protein n=1 Tax=Pseudonocardia xinjiangensis TaxID=75289 RepID=UPI003D92B2BE
MRSGSWAAVLPDLLAHIVDQLGPVVPEHLALTAAGPQVVLSTSQDRHRVVATETLGVPPDVDRAGLAVVATHMLADVQDLVVPHLRAPWPVTGTGRVTHPIAELVGTSLEMRFATRGDSPDDVVALRAYPVPENPPRVVTAG